jgi:uncharacterized protein
VNTSLPSDSVFRIILETLRELFTREGVLLISVFVLLIVWGPKGIPLFTSLFQDSINNDPTHTSYRLQLFSFGSGIVLLVLIPQLLIRFGFKQSLEEYGWGLGNVRLGLKLFLAALLLGLPLFYIGSLRPEMWVEYPMMYRGMSTREIKDVFEWSSFLTYELVYLLFFVVIEFVFRGYMLFGLRSRFGLYTVLVQMLPYCMWHLTKPMPELITTPIWGLAVGAVGLRVRSIWYTVAIHWLLNVFLDVAILTQRGVIAF